MTRTCVSATNMTSLTVSARAAPAFVNRARESCSVRRPRSKIKGKRSKPELRRETPRVPRAKARSCKGDEADIGTTTCLTVSLLASLQLDAGFRRIRERQESVKRSGYGRRLRDDAQGQRATVAIAPADAFLYLSPASWSARSRSASETCIPTAISSSSTGATRGTAP